jgi:antitoxin ParD1/3/4
MPVSLTSELEQRIHEKVESGLYLSADEVVREAMQLLEERDRLRQMKRDELRRELAVGLEQAARGEVAPLDMWAILAESQKRLAEKQPKT